MPKAKDRNKRFKEIQKSALLSEHALHDVMKEHRAKGGFTKRIGINEAQKIATRVWQGIERRMPGRKKLFFQQQIRPALSVSNTAVLSGE